MKTDSPAAFMSYVRFADEHDDGRLTEFCKRLSGEVRMQTGAPFTIFQDRSNIAWGQQWKQRIEESLDGATFLVAIVTPGFFSSPHCRAEFERFLDREKKLGRNDLILPVYHVGSPILDDEARRRNDPLAESIAARQQADWRDLRFEPFTSPQVGRTLAKMAAQIVAALDREVAAPSPAQDRQPVGQARPAPAEGVPAPLPVHQKPSVSGVAPSGGLAPKSEPPMLVVDALHRGHHATIGDALRAATPGDRILVRPGLYREGLVITKPVEIIGEGEAGEVVIEATGKDAVLFQSTMGRLVNLTIRQAGGGGWDGVDTAQGRLDMEDCDISSLGRACVAIHGGADPRLRRNRIHDAKQGGVFVYENGQGTLEDNDIFGNALSGVEIKGAETPSCAATVCMTTSSSVYGYGMAAVARWRTTTCAAMPKGHGTSSPAAPTMWSGCATGSDG